ncbi:hypothetical protein K7432_002035 [Basidiobolus ranarum]|uniref:Borealin N-terminal domain-containing protein n=1 Tax=Basidiobolus ranarum TaxID=34480 RepID=A0ABR2W8F1_9FUNG
MEETSIPPNRPSLSPEEKTQFIKDLEAEVQKRSNKLVLSTGQLCTSLLFLGELEINKLPKSVRALTLKEFLATKFAANKPLPSPQTSEEVVNPFLQEEEEEIKPTIFTESEPIITTETKEKPISSEEDIEPLRRSKRNKNPVKKPAKRTKKQLPSEPPSKSLISVSLGSGNVLELDPTQSPTAIKNLSEDAKKQLAERLATLQTQLNRFMSVIN